MTSEESDLDYDGMCNSTLVYQKRRQATGAVHHRRYNNSNAGILLFDDPQRLEQGNAARIMHSDAEIRRPHTSTTLSVCMKSCSYIGRSDDSMRTPLYPPLSNLKLSPG